MPVQAYICKCGPLYLLNKHGDLSFLLYFSKQTMVRNKVRLPLKRQLNQNWMLHLHKTNKKKTNEHTYRWSRNSWCCTLQRSNSRFQRGNVFLNKETQSQFSGVSCLKIISFKKQAISADKYASMFSRWTFPIVYLRWRISLVFP